MREMVMATPRQSCVWLAATKTQYGCYLRLLLLKGESGSPAAAAVSASGASRRLAICC